jgi:hypothetical protein
MDSSRPYGEKNEDASLEAVSPKRDHQSRITLDEDAPHPLQGLDGHRDDRNRWPKLDEEQRRLSRNIKAHCQQLLQLEGIAAATALLGAEIQQATGALQRQLLLLQARLFRQDGDDAQSIHVLMLWLEREPNDLGARRLLHALLRRTKGFAALDDSLHSAVALARRQQQFRFEAWFSMQRGDVLLSVLQRPTDAADCFRQAADAFERCREPPHVLRAQLLVLEATFVAGASSAVQDEAFHAALAAAQPLFREYEVLELVLHLRKRHQTQLEMPALAHVLSVPALPPPDESKVVFRDAKVAGLLDEVPVVRPVEQSGDGALPWLTEREMEHGVATPKPFSESEAEAEDRIRIPLSSPQQVLTAERKLLYAEVRSNPLRAEGYLQLAENFDASGDPTRATLMLEVARALEGDEHAAPLEPRLVLPAASRLRLRHPSLRGATGELFDLVGQLFCTLYAAKEKPDDGERDFELDSGKWARPTANALLCAVRILGIRPPSVKLSSRLGPPFSAVFRREPVMLVGRVAVQQQLKEAELRFFAGRALVQFEPAILVLRMLQRNELAYGLSVLRSAVEGPAQSAEARVMKGGLSAEAQARIWQIFREQTRPFDFSALAESARHSMNRAGLLVSGGVAPALEAMRAKRATDEEMTQLIRFAASERYLQLKDKLVAA